MKEMRHTNIPSCLSFIFLNTFFSFFFCKIQREIEKLNRVKTRIGDETRETTVFASLFPADLSEWPRCLRVYQDPAARPLSSVFLSRRPGASGPRVGVDGIFGSTCTRAVCRVHTRS